MLEISKHTFRDNKGREWSVVIDLYVIEQVQELCGVDLFKLFEDGAAKLFNDVRNLVNVLYVVCKEQADKAGVSDIDFGRGISGDTIDDASNALLVGAANFYPSRQRTLKLAMMEKTTVAANQAMEKVIAAVKAIDPEAFFKGATNSPAQPE